MNDELTALQETAVQARAKAEELKATVTDTSSDEEKASVEDAEKAATDAENAFADAKAKADAAATDQGDGGVQQKVGDPCVNADGVSGTLQPDDNGNFVCVVEAAPSDQSRTDFVTGARAGDQCTCPDGRKGTVHKFDEGLVCIPNHDQSE